MSLDSVHTQESLSQRKPLYLHILGSVQPSLWINLSATFFALAKLDAKLAALTSSSAFFLAATNNSVHLW